MKKGLRKRLILTFALCGLFTLFITLPQASGYGTSGSNATTIYNGTTTEPMLTTSYAYYKICCSAGDSLSVTLTHYGGYDLDLRLYDIGGTSLDYSSSSSSDDVCAITAPTNDYVIIRVSNFDDVVPSTINLIVTGATGSGCVMPPTIPGFEVLPTLFGLIAATFLALMILKSRRQILN